MARQMLLGICFQLFLFVFFKPYHKEKCSESTGINLVLFCFNSFSIRFQPHIIDSLFAIAIFLVSLIIFKVGSNPSIPTYGAHDIVNFFIILLISSKELNTLTFCLYNFFELFLSYQNFLKLNF